VKNQLLKRSVAEAIGTFAIVFFGCGALMVGERFAGSMSGVAVPVIFGLTVAAMIYTFGHVSGAHFNPAVTLAFAIARHFPGKEVAAYWFGQFTGAIVASTLLYFILPPGTHFGETITHVPLVSAFVWEVMVTFFLMLVVMAVATDTRAVGTMAGAAIGITVMIGAFVGGPLTGASMNPARSLGPAIFAHTLGTMGLYFIGPIIGAALAAMLYAWMKSEA